jgi:hypothetical protein
VSRREKGSEAAPLKACCMISDLLEESGIDREHIRRVRKQVLRGIILLCQWQLERMDETRERSTAAKAGSKGRKIAVE